MLNLQKQIKPLHLSTIDGGGAAIASIRLHRAFVQQGIASRYAVGHKSSDKSDIIDLKNTMTALEARWYYRAHKKNLFLNQQAQRTGAIWWSDNRILHTIPLRLRMMDADLIHMNWVGSGLLPINAMSWIKKPIVWTMHDNWAFTGGCHKALDCKQFEIGCGRCPQLQSDDPHDKSYQNYRLKEKSWQNLDLTVVTPSHWLGERARASSIFKDYRVEVIPNGLDINTFKHLDKQAARQKLSLNPSEKYIFFGAMNLADRNKGSDLLIAALHKLAEQHQNIHLLIVGNYSETLTLPEQFQVHPLGFINDEALSNTIYAAADICIVPSRQENLSNTIMESLASGTPVIAFDSCGNPDLIRHQAHGYLAKAFSIDDLAKGMAWGLSQDAEAGQLARQYVVDQYNIEHIAKRYLNLYQEILMKN